MKVIVDTCIWSIALRRNSPKPHSSTNELKKLIEDARVQMIGPIRQELLSGITLKSQFEKLKQYLTAFDDLIIQTDDYILAAEFFNLCRNKGIQGSFVDFLICALSTKHQLAIFTDDNDFKLYAKILSLKLHTF